MDHIDMIDRSTTDSEAPLLSTSTGTTKRKDRKNLFSTFFGKEKKKETTNAPIPTTNKENDEDLFDILSRVTNKKRNLLLYTRFLEKAPMLT